MVIVNLLLPFGKNHEFCGTTTPVVILGGHLHLDMATGDERYWLQ